MYNHVDNVDKCKKEEKNTGRGCGTICNFGINIPEIGKVILNLGVKKETAGYENPDGPLIFCIGSAEQNPIYLKVVRR